MPDTMWYLRQLIGEFIVQLATRQAEVDRLQEALAKEQHHQEAHKDSPYAG